MSHGTDSVRTNLAGSVGVKTVMWEFKYHFCSVLSRQESRALTPPQRPTPKTGRDSLKMILTVLCHDTGTLFPLSVFSVVSKMFVLSIYGF